MRFALPVCLLMLGSSLLVAQGKRVSSKAVTGPIEQTLLQLEEEWNRALIAKDYKRVDRIMADDWIGIDFRGMSTTKAESMAELRSGESGNQTVEPRDIKVKVFGDTAIVYGVESETSRYHGKDSSGQYAWMDVFVKRGDRWEAVASQSTKIAK